MRWKPVSALVIIMWAGTLWAQQGAPPLAIATETLPAILTRQQYEVHLQAAGGTPPYRWNVVAGDLPEGLNLDPTSGSISGTPAKKQELSFTIELSDATGHSIRREYKVKVAAPLVIDWLQRPRVEGHQINGSVKVSNGTKDDFDLTVIIVAVNEYGKAFALGYEHFDLKPESDEMEIPFGSTVPQGTYVVHADVVSEVDEKRSIFRDRKQTEKPLAVTAEP